MPGRLAALCLGLLALAACGLEKAGAPGAGRAAQSFQVALLTPGSIADGGWNQGAYDGLRRIEAELGAEISHVETRTPAEFEEGFRDYASRGYDLVFGHGFEYQEAAAKVAAEFPKTIFVTTSGSTVRAERRAHGVRARAGHLSVRARSRGARAAPASSA